MCQCEPEYLVRASDCRGGLAGLREVRRAGFSPYTITWLNLSVDRLLPLHGRIVPLADLHRAIGRSN